MLHSPILSPRDTERRRRRVENNQNLQKSIHKLRKLRLGLDNVLIDKLSIEKANDIATEIDQNKENK